MHGGYCWKKPNRDLGISDYNYYYEYWDQKAENCTFVWLLKRDKIMIKNYHYKY